MHPKAIYLHQGQQYQVERLDFDERRAYVKRVSLEYYTDAIRYTQVRVLETAASARFMRGDARGSQDADETGDDGSRMDGDRRDDDLMRCRFQAGFAGRLLVPIAQHRARMGMCWCDRRWWASRK